MLNILFVGCPVLFTQVLADRTEIGARVSAPLLAIVIGSCLAAFRILPSASVHTAAYDVVSESNALVSL